MLGGQQQAGPGSQQAPPQLLSQLGNQLPSQMAGQLPGQLPGQLQAQLLSQLRAQAQPQTVSQMQSQVHGQVQGQLPAQLLAMQQAQQAPQLWGQAQPGLGLLGAANGGLGGEHAQSRLDLFGQGPSPMGGQPNAGYRQPSPSQMLLSMLQANGELMTDSQASAMLDMMCALPCVLFVCFQCGYQPARLLAGLFGE